MYGKKSFDWFSAGVILGILASVVPVATKYFIGASAGFAYLSALLTGFGAEPYVQRIAKSGTWEIYFIIGTLAGAFASSVINRDFKIQLIPERWRETKGSSKKRRMFWAFAGGFMILFGARLAGGCTSGHILSGGIQLAVSGMVFGTIALVTLFVTAKLFYGRK
ncbi:MAG: YeeE/YedE family protein [Nitrospiraceae bacterium]|nr:YeeE/YedE family protein [Nitrospiraceae bacterium]